MYWTLIANLSGLIMDYQRTNPSSHALISCTRLILIFLTHGMLWDMGGMHLPIDPCVALS